MSRLEWVLSGLLALLIIVIAVMMLLFWNLNRQQSALPAASEETSSEEAAEDVQATASTAQEAYELAHPTAQTWAEDARLLSASATWAESASFMTEDAGWSLLFYSPERSETGLVSVSNGQARLLRNSATNRSLLPLSLENWQVDSPAVIETLMTHGGEEFVQMHNQATLSLTFNALDALQWQAQLIDREQQTILTVEIDPISGAVTTIKSPEGEE